MSGVVEPALVELVDWGEISMPDDTTVLMDGGTHGCVGHTLRVTGGMRATWERRLDSMGDPEECSGAGGLVLPAADANAFCRLAMAMWDFAGAPAPVPSGDEYPEVPRYVWAVVMRRDGEIRVLEGPPFGHPWDDPPAPVAEALSWMAEKVAEWCRETRNR